MQAFAACGILLAALPAEAAHGPSQARHEGSRAAQEAPARVAENLATGDPVATSSIRSAVDGAVNCDRSRKRLFVEGEGWIVRKVTTCY